MIEKHKSSCLCEEADGTDSVGTVERKRKILICQMVRVSLEATQNNKKREREREKRKKEKTHIHLSE